MISFLDYVAQNIIDENYDFQNIKIVLPSNRASLVLRKTLIKKIKQPIISPEIISISEFINELSGLKKKIIEIWCLAVASFFSGYLAFYFIKMLIISYKFQERSEGADEILIWIPQTSVAIGSTIFFISVFHQLILMIKKN